MQPQLGLFRTLVRFWGWRENEVEQARASSEDPSNIPGFGESDLSPYMQGVAHRNSAFSQLKFSEWRLNGFWNEGMSCGGRRRWRWRWRKEELGLENVE